MDAVLVLRQGLLFGHLIAFAVAIAEIIRGDWRLLHGRQLDLDALHRTSQIVSLALAALWLTGLGLVFLDTGFDPGAIVQNPKLLTKLIVVAALTGNGLLLHLVAFPMLPRPVARTGPGAVLIAVLGAISTVSWFFAAFVGVARIIASAMTLERYLAFYGLSLAAGIAVAAVAIAPLLRRRLNARRPRAFAPLPDAARWQADTEGQSEALPGESAEPRRRVA